MREFRALWFADLQSTIGDQLARVALSVLVYRDTGSGFLTAGVYALTFLPSLFGSLFLGTLADRVPRRALLITGDLIRAALLATMALPQLPIGVITPILVVAVIIGTPWRAAESALVSEILAGERYVLGTGLRVAAAQGAQLIGFGVGGAAVATIGAHWALLLDAVTYVVSALLIAAGVASRPRPRRDPATPAPTWLDGARVAFGTPYLRLLLAFTWLAGLIVVPEGLAAPYADAIGGGSGTVGLLLAASPAGLVVGTIVFTGFIPPRWRARIVGPMAVFSCLPTTLLWSEPDLPLAMTVQGVSGVACAYQAQVMTEFVVSIPVSQRGQAISIGAAGMLAAQGIGLLVGGILAQEWHVGPAIAVCAGAGAVVGLFLTVVHVVNRRNGHAPSVTQLHTDPAAALAEV